MSNLKTGLSIRSKTAPLSIYGTNWNAPIILGWCRGKIFGVIGGATKRICRTVIENAANVILKTIKFRNHKLFIKSRGQQLRVITNYAWKWSELVTEGYNIDVGDRFEMLATDFLWVIIILPLKQSKSIPVSTVSSSTFSIIKFWQLSRFVRTSVRRGSESLSPVLRTALMNLWTSKLSFLFFDLSKILRSISSFSVLSWPIFRKFSSISFSSLLELKHIFISFCIQKLFLRKWRLAGAKVKMLNY